MQMKKISNQPLEPLPTELAPPKLAGIRERKREEKTDQILNASIAVFTEEGYSGFSMRKVANRADVRLNTIQHHFGDLEALLVSTVQAMSLNYVDKYQQVADNTDIAPLERLEIIIDLNLRDALKYSVQAFFAESQVATLHNEKIFSVVANIYTRYVDIIANLIKQIADRSDTEALILARMIVSWQEGVAITQRFTPERSPTTGSVIVRIKAACLALAAGDKLGSAK